MKSIRSAFGLLLLAFFAVSAVAEDVLLKFVPAGTEYVVSVDVEALRKTSLLRPLDASAAESGVDAIREEFEREHGFRLEDCSRLLFAGGGKRLRGMLVQTGVPEPVLTERLRKLGDRFSTSTDQGRTFYHLLTTDSIPDLRRTITATYLAPDVILASEHKYIGPFLLAGLGKSPTIQAAPGKPPVWSFFDIDAMTGGKKKKKRDIAAILLNGVRTIRVELNTMEKSGWKITGEALCKDAASARNAAMQLPLYLQFGASVLFADDPNLATELMNQLKVTPENERVRLELNIPGELADRIRGFLESQAAKRLAPPPPPANPPQKAPGA